MCGGQSGEFARGCWGFKVKGINYGCASLVSKWLRHLKISCSRFAPCKTNFDQKKPTFLKQKRYHLLIIHTVPFSRAYRVRSPSTRGLNPGYNLPQRRSYGINARQSPWNVSTGASLRDERILFNLKENRRQIAVARNI